MTSEECWRRGRERRGMYPWTLLEILRQFKHPRILTLGVHADRWGARAREAVGVSPHGTLFLSQGCGPKAHEKELEGPVPQNHLPYAPVRTAVYSPQSDLFKHGEILRGWRSLLDDLVKAGILIGCEEMSWLIGRHSRKLAGEFRIVPPDWSQRWTP